MDQEQLGRTVADRILVSYRGVDVDPDENDGWTLGDSGWIEEQMREESYLKYLWRVHGGPVAVGEEWEEFVNCGCSSPQDVVIRVEAVDGGDVFGEETTIDIAPLARLDDERER